MSATMSANARQLAALPPTFTCATALEAGLSEWQLRVLVERRVVERVGRGLYRRSDAPPVDLDLIEVAVRAPRATLCLTSALARHDLTDIIPARIDIAVPRSQRVPTLSLPVAWHRFADRTFELGRGELHLEQGRSIGLYSAERSIVDAYRLRHIEGLELGREALRRWLRSRQSSPAGLLQMARLFPKAARQLRNDLELLL